MFVSNVYGRFIAPISPARCDIMPYSKFYTTVDDKRTVQNIDNGVDFIRGGAVLFISRGAHYRQFLFLITRIKKGRNEFLSKCFFANLSENTKLGKNVLEQRK